MNSISLNNLRFFAYHGCLDFEKKNGGWYEVNVDCSLNLDIAGRSDRLEETVDYSAIYSLVKEEMKKPSKLIENVAWRILERMKTEFPEIIGCTVSIAKINPPFEGTPDDYKGAVATVKMSY